MDTVQSRWRASSSFILRSGYGKQASTLTVSSGAAVLLPQRMAGDHAETDGQSRSPDTLTLSQVNYCGLFSIACTLIL